MNSSAIYDSTFFSNYVSSAPTAVEAKSQLTSTSSTSKDQNFDVVMAYYVFHLRQLAIESFEQFAGIRSEDAQKRTEEDRGRENRKSETEAMDREGQRRQIENLVEGYQDELIRCGIHRQAGKLRYFQGQHLDSSGRHLQLPV